MPSSRFARQLNRAVPPPICIKPPQPPVDYPNQLPSRLLASVSWYPHLRLINPFDVRTTFYMNQTSVGPIFGRWTGPPPPIAQAHVNATLLYFWADDRSRIIVTGSLFPWYSFNAFARDFTRNPATPYFTRNMVAYFSIPGTQIRVQITA